MTTIKGTRLICLVVTTICLGCFSATAQNNIIVKYYDSSWVPATKEDAYYLTKIVKADSFYRYTSYYAKSQKLNCISTYKDTLFSNRIGLLLSYYENGQLQDSSFYSNEKSVLSNAFHYYQNGQLAAHYTKTGNTEKTVGYDETGQKIDDFIYLKEAQFRDDPAEWIDYLSNTIKTNVPIKKGAPKGSYQVIIKFIVDKDGSVTGITPETKLGYGMEEEVMRVIKKSPKWNHLIYLNKAEKAYRRQPITFIVE